MMALMTSSNFYDDMDANRPPQGPQPTAQERLKRDAIAVVTQRLLDESPGEWHARIEQGKGILLSGALIYAKGEVPYVKDGNEEWVLENDRCTCPEHLEAPSRVCAHRYALKLYKRALLWAKEQSGHPVPSVSATGSESPFSVNVSRAFAGGSRQITCRTGEASEVEGLLLMAEGIMDRFQLRLADGIVDRFQQRLNDKFPDEPEPEPEPAPQPAAKSRFYKPEAKSAQPPALDDDVPECEYHRLPMQRSKWNPKQWRCTKRIGQKPDGKAEYCSFELMEH